MPVILRSTLRAERPESPGLVIQIVDHGYERVVLVIRVFPHDFLAARHLESMRALARMAAEEVRHNEIPVLLNLDSGRPEQADILSVLAGELPDDPLVRRDL